MKENTDSFTSRDVFADTNQGYPWLKIYIAQAISVIFGQLLYSQPWLLSILMNQPSVDLMKPISLRNTLLWSFPFQSTQGRSLQIWRYEGCKVLFSTLCLPVLPKAPSVRSNNRRQDHGDFCHRCLYEQNGRMCGCVPVCRFRIVLSEDLMPDASRDRPPHYTWCEVMGERATLYSFYR